MTKFICPGRAGPVFRHDHYDLGLMEPAVCLRAWLAFFILRTLKLGGTILSHKVDLQRCMSSKRNTTPDFRLHVTPIIAQYNVELII